MKNLKTNRSYTYTFVRHSIIWEIEDTIIKNNACGYSR